MKELHTGANYWTSFSQHKNRWSPLNENLEAKVVIIGGGISGLLCAYKLHQLGIESVIVEAKQIAQGSTLASTGLLQYCSDIMLSELRKRFGKVISDTFYLKCYAATLELKEISAVLSSELGPIQAYGRASMQYSSTPQDAIQLKKEYAALSSIGLPCALWDRSTIEQHLSFSKPLALVTSDDLEINPYLFVIRLAEYLSLRGVRIFEYSKASKVSKLCSGQYEVVIGKHTIKSEYVIHSVGYQFEQLNSSLKCNVNRSYAIVTKPIAEQIPWHEQMMIWETARPYYYIRTTPDKRVIIGGLDEHKSILNHRVPSRNKIYNKLLSQLQTLFPHLLLSIDFAWNATFVESIDQLPYIGSVHEHNKQWYVLGYGGNGTVYSMLGANIVARYIAYHELDPHLNTLLSPARIDHKAY